MKQLMQGLSHVNTYPGVITGCMASAAALNSTLVMDVDKGLVKVGTLDSDGSITNLASLGMNQPGKVLEIAPAGLTLTMPSSAAGIYFLWLKTDGTLAAVIETASGDPLDAVPSGQEGPNPFKGELLNNSQQEGPLRRQIPACVLLAKVTISATAVTAVDNTVRTSALL